MRNVSFSGERRVRGLLVPYDELSHESVTSDPVMFSAGVIEIPADPMVVTFNRDHSQFAPIGRAVAIEETPEGIVAEFEIGRTPEGDAALADIRAGLKSLSAEIAGLVRKGVRAVRGALTGASLVPVGALPSAALFSIAPTPPTQKEPIMATRRPAAGNRAARRAAARGKTITTPPTARARAEALFADGATPTLDDIVEVIEEIEESVEVLEEDVDELEDEIDPSAPDEEPAATSLARRIARVPAGVPRRRKEQPLTAGALFAAHVTRSPDALRPFAGLNSLFAISTVQNSGPTTLTIGADTHVPQALQELWDHNGYTRKYVPLLTHRDLTAYTATGWRWTEGKTPEVGEYTGNTAEVPSNAVDTESVTVTAQRLAGGHRLDRRFYDFPDQGVIESYYRKMSESYARLSDAKALAAAVAGATAETVTGTTYRYGVAAGLAGLVDGALAVLESDNTPSYAVVSPELWRDILFTGKDEVLAYLSSSLGLEEGNLSGFQLLPGAVGTGKVLVGAKPAASFFELPGVPIRVDALAVHNGSTDAALFGYYATIVEAPKALVIVDTAQYTEPTPPTTIIVDSGV